ncbi:hypothetical protein Pmani_039740 [Petrolisthes manimaculis]|uniref:Uncharacterized protein n=1 Tax=Petrolisthes manimaculis TaxID=1843537 RepID=A0AAE1NBZ7_9EUCA|nr:hypothetical protein Pmani_039740 [Petrolisthes manimaculis]
MASSEQTLSEEGGGGGGGEEAEDEAETGARELKPSSTAGSSDLDTDTDALDMGDVNGNSTKVPRRGDKIVTHFPKTTTLTNYSQLLVNMLLVLTRRRF